MLDQESDCILSKTDFPQFAVIATRPSHNHHPSEFEFIVPCQILSHEYESDNVYIKFIAVNTSNTTWMRNILSLLYPDVTDAQWKAVCNELLDLI